MRSKTTRRPTRRIRAISGAACAAVFAFALTGGCPAPVDPGDPGDGSAQGINPDGNGVDQNGGNPGGNPDDNPGDNPGGNPGGPPASDAAPKNVSESLTKLGVDTTTSPRVDETGEALPEDYSPLGASCSLAQTRELFLVGLQLLDPAPAGAARALDNRAAFVELADDDTGDVGLNVTELLEPGRPWEQDRVSSHPGAGSSSDSAASIRAFAAGDIDGDGMDEIVIARYQPPSDPNAFGDVLISVLDDQESAGTATDFSQPERRLTALKHVRDVNVAAGDFDGDGDADIVLGVSTSNGAMIMPLDLGPNGVFKVRDDQQWTLPQRIDNSTISFESATGNIDLDNGIELVIVVNEYDSSQRVGRSRYWVYDDANTGFKALASEQAVRYDDGTTHDAQSADVALGDLDGDARDEIVFGGITRFEQDVCAPTEHVYLSLEDAADPNQPLGITGGAVFSFNYIPTGRGCNQNSHLLKVHHTFVNTLDIDGDGLAEVQVNLRIFDDWTNPNGPWTEIHTLPRSEFLDIDNGQTRGGVVSRATTDMVTGDVTGDGRDDVITFAQWRGGVTVWGLDGPSLESAAFKQILTIPTAFYNSQARVFPVVLPCNIDKDGLALKYSNAEYRLVFTEPIIMAALAAAPCVGGIDQNYEACRTAYGTSESQRLGADGTISVRASTWVGAETKIFGIGASVKETITATASFSAGRSYELEQTVEYVTGPVEDTVIVATLPVDRYTYSVISHPDPNMVGREVVINMPRTPITLQIEREFYNASTPPGSFKVGRNVFLHTPAEIDSYPTEADADALIDTGGLGHLGPLGELVDAAGAALGPIAEHLLGKGIKSSRAIPVGANNGETSVELKFSENTDYRAGAEIDYEIEAETTAGIVIGGSVGGSVEAGLSWGSSNATIYRGTVGEIAPADFPGNSYSYGLFTYVYNYGDPSKPQFEVINYWVDR